MRELRKYHSLSAKLRTSMGDESYRDLVQEFASVCGLPLPKGACRRRRGCFGDAFEAEAWFEQAFWPHFSQSIRETGFDSRLRKMLLDAGWSLGQRWLPRREG